jgi:hypothetical protein
MFHKHKWIILGSQPVTVDGETHIEAGILCERCALAKTVKVEKLNDKK